MIWLLLYEVALALVVAFFAVLLVSLDRYRRFCQKAKFVEQPGLPNQILLLDPKGENFISYNPKLELRAAWMKADDDEGETAMLWGGRWHVLIGDHRAAYEAAHRRFGLVSVKRYFRKMEPEWGSTWSTHNITPEQLAKWLEARLDEHTDD